MEEKSQLAQWRWDLANKQGVPWMGAGTLLPRQQERCRVVFQAMDWRTSLVHGRWCRKMGSCSRSSSLKAHFSVNHGAGHQPHGVSQSIQGWVVEERCVGSRDTKESWGVPAWGTWRLNGASSLLFIYLWVKSTLYSGPKYLPGPFHLLYLSQSQSQ